MEKIKLGDLCKPSAGQIKEDEDTLIDYIDISSVDNETKKITGYQTIIFGESPSRARKVVKRGNILVSTVRPNLNAVALLEEDTPNVTVASTGFCVLESKDDVDPRFIFNFCKSKPFIDDMVSQATGASYPAVSDKIVRSALVPKYSYQEQQSISSVLDKLTGIIDGRRTELLELDNLIKARFVEMFGDPVSNPMNWECTRLADKCDIVTGNTPSRKVEKYYGNAIEWIKSDNITEDMFLTTAVEFLSSDGEKVGRTVEAGSILMTCIAGSLRSIGNVAVANRKVAFNQQINAIVPNNQNTYFMYEQFKLSKEHICSGVNMSLKGILSKGQLSDISFIFPPIELQNQFAVFVHQVDKSKVAVQKALDETQTLFDSLMQEYFG